jgi:hypothetical protein
MASPSAQQSPRGQSHWPSKQVNGGWQTFPQAPQLLLSQHVATHSQLQTVSPSAQSRPGVQPHCPSKQTCGGTQALPQAPQCALLQQVSTQIPSHTA